MGQGARVRDGCRARGRPFDVFGKIVQAVAACSVSQSGHVGRRQDTAGALYRSVRTLAVRQSAGRIQRGACRGLCRFDREVLGALNLWMAGYCNDVYGYYGYLPSERVLAEGGYESRGLYVETGLFAPQVQNVVLRAVAEMAERAGRTIPRVAER